MKYRVEVTVKGGMGRPTYDGYVDVYVDGDDHDPDFQMLAFRKLKRTTFPEIWKDSVVVKAARVMVL